MRMNNHKRALTNTACKLMKSFCGNNKTVITSSDDKSLQFCRPQLNVTNIKMYAKSPIPLESSKQKRFETEPDQRARGRDEEE